MKIRKKQIFISGPHRIGNRTSKNQSICRLPRIPPDEEWDENDTDHEEMPLHSSTKDFAISTVDFALDSAAPASEESA